MWWPLLKFIFFMWWKIKGQSALPAGKRKSDKDRSAVAIVISNENGFISSHSSNRAFYQYYSIYNTLHNLLLLIFKVLWNCLYNNYYSHFRDWRTEAQSLHDLVIVKAQLIFSWAHPELVLRSLESVLDLFLFFVLFFLSSN